MKTKKYLYSLAASALFLSGAYAADTELVLDASQDGLTWADALWSNGVPTAETTVLIDIADNTNPLIIDGAYTIGNLTANGYTSLLIDGAGNSLTTTFTGAPYGDVVLNNNSSLLVQNGASITIANGMSLKVRDNSSAVFDNATFTGGLYDTINSLTFRNGATWNVKGYHAQMQNTNILVQDSSIVGGIAFGNGQTGSNSKLLTLDHSTWNGSNGGINVAGVVEVLNGSSVSNTNHFNIGHDGNMTAGLYKLVVRGTSAEKRSSVAGNNLWLNVGAGSQSIMSFEGYTDATFGGVRPTPKDSGGDMSIVFSGTSNNFTMGNCTEFGSSRDNYLLASGNWIITTAHMDGETEVFATKTTFTETSNFAIKGSKAEGGSTIVAGIDWAGATNTFSVASNTAIDHDMNAGGTSLKYITVRDGAEMNLHNTYVGSEETSSASGKSGTARLTATDSGTTLNISGSLNLRNSIYSDATTQNFVTVSDGAAMTVGAINIATNAASKGGSSVFEISGADSSVTFSSISIGNTGATGGEGTLKISNGATFAIKNLSINANANTAEAAQFGVLVDNATITGEWKMGAGSKSKFLTLQNGSTWNANNGGINASGTVSVLDSSISNTPHLNIGAENGNASGKNLLFVQGSSSTKLSSISASNLWWNTNSGDTSTTLHQAGNTNITISGASNSSNNTNGGGNVLWLFSGDNNKFKSSSGDSTWGDNAKGVNTTGSWKITTAQTVDSVETFATNSSFEFSTMTIRSSSKAGNNLTSGIDWAGETNSILANSNLNIQNSTAASSNANAFVIIRDKATAEIKGSTTIGVSNALSGDALFEIKNGASATLGNTLTINNSTLANSQATSTLTVDKATLTTTARNVIGTDSSALSGDASFKVVNGATYNMGNNLAIINSTVSGSTGTSSFMLDGSTLNRTGGNLFIGTGSHPRDDNPYQDAISGTAVATIKNADAVTFGGNILLAGSSVDLRESESSHSNLAKLVIENTDLTINGELFFGHQQSNGGTIYGGTAIIEINGENSALRSPNKTLYSGYNHTVYGGTREINVNGKNNTLAFATNESFYMNASGNGTQYGGDLSVNFNGEGHTFSVKDFQIGRTNAMGGSNTVYSKGTNAANKNQILLSESNVSIRGGAAGSTIVNTFHLAGNTILKRSNGETVNVGLATSATAGGTAAFRITGENNELYAYNFNMNSANSTGAKAIFEIEGSTHIISIINQFGFYAPSSNHALSTLSFVADADGISTINTNSVQAFAGVLNIDFSKYAAQTYDEMSFTLISANNSWSAQNYETIENNDYVNVIKTNEDDTWQIVKEGNNLMLYYTSSAVIPEPSTFAAIFGAIALAFAAYRRKKQ